jgi:lysophospholipid acyltransferase (LPLAT)-like uncharacterized protein
LKGNARDSEPVTGRPWWLKPLGFATAALLRLLGATWRVREVGHNPLEHEPGAQIGALWHRDLLLTAWHYRDRGFSVAVSRSRDGELICSVLDHLGYRGAARGSSSRGGTAALRGLLRILAEGTTVSILADGPRGPAERAKIGVIVLARLSRVAATPVAFAARPCLRFPSWDGTVLPLPFARVVCQYGSPISVPPDADEPAEEELRRAFERELERIGSEAAATLGFGADPR